MSFAKPQSEENIEATELQWETHSHDDGEPYRGDIVQIDNDYQFLLERDEEGEIRMRHVGFYMEALFCSMLAGRRFASLFSVPHQPLFQNELDALFLEPAKLYLSSISDHSDVSFGLFPVRADFGPTDYAIGAISLQELPDYSVTTLGVRCVEKVKLVQDEKSLRYGFAEERAGFGEPASSPFRLIQGGGEGLSGAKPKAGFKLIQHVKREP